MRQRINLPGGIDMRQQGPAPRRSQRPPPPRQPSDSRPRTRRPAAGPVPPGTPPPGRSCRASSAVGCGSGSASAVGESGSGSAGGRAVGRPGNRPAAVGRYVRVRHNTKLRVTTDISPPKVAPDQHLWITSPTATCEGIPHTSIRVIRASARYDRRSSTTARSDSPGLLLLRRCRRRTPCAGGP
jgi:hypothetical protein